MKCVKRLLPVMKNIYEKLGGIIIDEFSMGKADVMDWGGLIFKVE